MQVYFAMTRPDMAGFADMQKIKGDKFDRDGFP